AQPTARGYALAVSDVRPQRRPSGPLQGLGRLDDQIIFRIQAGRGVGVAFDPPIAPYVEIERIAKVYEAKSRLQQMVAVRATARHMQEKIDFCRGRHIV